MSNQPPKDQQPDDGELERADWRSLFGVGPEPDPDDDEPFLDEIFDTDQLLAVDADPSAEDDEIFDDVLLDDDEIFDDVLLDDDDDIFLDDEAEIATLPPAQPAKRASQPIELDVKPGKYRTSRVMAVHTDDESDDDDLDDEELDDEELDLEEIEEEADNLDAETDVTSRKLFESKGGGTSPQPPPKEGEKTIEQGKSPSTRGKGFPKTNPSLPDDEPEASSEESEPIAAEKPISAPPPAPKPIASGQPLITNLNRKPNEGEMIPLTRNYARPAPPPEPEPIKAEPEIEPEQDEIEAEAEQDEIEQDEIEAEAEAEAEAEHDEIEHDEIEAEAEHDEIEAEAEHDEIEAEAAPDAETVYRYRLNVPLSAELELAINIARHAARLPNAPLNSFNLLSDFQTDDLYTVAKTLNDWAAQHLPLNLQLERVGASVEGAQRYLAYYELEPAAPLLEAHQALLDALDPLIEHQAASDELPFEARLMVSDYTAPAAFPDLIHALQLGFSNHALDISRLEVLRLPQGESGDRWEVAFSVPLDEAELEALKPAPQTNESENDDDEPAAE